jgi:hypothetical protein
MDNTGEYFKIYQAAGGNYMHRPIYGASSLNPSTLYRITSTPAVFLVDPNNGSDFYNFDV